MYSGLPPSTNYLQDTQPDFIQPTQEPEPSLFPELEASFSPSDQELSALLEGWTDPLSQPTGEQTLSGARDIRQGTGGAYTQGLTDQSGAIYASIPVFPSSALPISGEFELQPQLQVPAESYQLPIWEGQQNPETELPFLITTEEGDIWDNGLY